jgi:hypothetical protein
MAIKYVPIPNGYKIFQMSQNIYKHFPLKGPPKYTKTSGNPGPFQELKKSSFLHSPQIRHKMDRMLETVVCKTGLPDLSLYIIPKLGKSIPKDHKI